MVSSALPSDSKVKKLRAPLAKSAKSTLSVTAIEDENRTTDTLKVNPSNDYVGELKRSARSPALANDFLTAHHVFGDYIRKHEVPRKVLHSSIGFITIYEFSHGRHKEFYIRPLTIAFVAILSLDFLRFRWKRFNYLYCQAVGFLMREKEINHFNGVLWYIAGAFYLFKFFPDDVAIISILLLSWCDTAASTIGRAYGHLTPKIARNKSLAGSTAAFLVGVGTCYYFYGLYLPRYQPLHPWYKISWTQETSHISFPFMCFFAGLIAALSEGIDLFNWDDNFTIPLLSGTLLQLIITIFHK